MTERQVTFITGNQDKADYLAKLLDISILHKKVELDELQSLDLHEIVEHKVRQAFKVVGSPVLVEDVSLEFCALGPLPGPFIKWFLKYAGDKACCQILNDFENRKAIMRCTFGYFDGKRLELFDSSMPGTISEVPRGTNGYGFDTIFINLGYEITRAEMSLKENERTYRDQMKPIAKLSTFLRSI